MLIFLQLKPDETYLSYYDTRLFQADVDTVTKRDWLTDNVICFWEEYLEHEKMSDYIDRARAQGWARPNIILLRPSISHLLLRTPLDQIAGLSGALPSLDGVSHMFLTINDNRELEVAEGGSHWSLLLVSLVDGVAFHYDSLAPHNYTDACELTHHLAIASNRPLRLVSLDDTTPRQENNNDCGVHVCLVMQHLLLNKLLTPSMQQINMSLGNTSIDAVAGRKEIARTIESRRKEGQRRS